MNSYSVRQIADMLDTNPETVRRWIREKKLAAVQVSRKTGNIVTDDDLQRFLKVTPKYASRFAASIGLLSPGVGLAALVGSIGLGAMEYYVEKKELDYRILPEEISNYLKDSITRLEGLIIQKKENIQQLQEEVAELQRQVGAIQYLLDHNGFSTQDEEITPNGKHIMEGE